MTNTIIAVGLAVLVLLALFIRSERKRGRDAYGTAIGFERDGDYEAAIFYYAVAMNAGSDKRICQEKIKGLWRQYGPFDFNRLREGMMADGCRDKSCGEGFHSLTVSDIRKIVGA